MTDPDVYVLVRDPGEIIKSLVLTDPDGIVEVKAPSRVLDDVEVVVSEMKCDQSCSYISATLVLLVGTLLGAEAFGARVDAIGAPVRIAVELSKFVWVTGVVNLVVLVKNGAASEKSHAVRIKANVLQRAMAMRVAQKTKGIERIEQAESLFVSQFYQER